MDDIQRMLNIIDVELKKKGIKRGEIAKLFDVSPATVSNMFNHKHKIEYMKFITLTRIAFGKYNHDFIRRFCRSAKAKVEVEAMEWAYGNGDMEILELLIKRDKEDKRNGDDPRSERLTITHVYELQLQRLTGKLDKEQFFNKTQDMKMDFRNMDTKKFVLLNINCMYAFKDMTCYTSVWPLGISLLQQIEKIENDYLKRAFEIRIKLCLIYAGIRGQQYIEAEKMANELIECGMMIENFPMYYNNVLICLSEIYVLTDFPKSSSYIKEAVQMMNDGYFDTNEGWKHMIKSTYDFIHIHNNQFVDLYLEAEDERAHRLAKGSEEEKKEATGLLNKLQEEYGENDEFVMYYKALALEDAKLMIKAKDLFHKAGDFHYSQLAIDFIENSCY